MILLDFHAYKDDVYLGPKDLDEKVSELYLPALGAGYTEVKVEGTFKGEHYRYWAVRSSRGLLSVS